MLRTLLSLFCICSTAALHGNVVINEVLAFNRNTLQNAGEFPDCIELKNIGATPVDLNGYRVSDDPLLPTKFSFSGTTTLAPGATILLYADSSFSAPGVHLGFGLNSDGDTVLLYNATGTQINSVAFGPQAPDVSLGRIPDGTGTFQANVPSLAASNTAATLGAVTSLKVNEYLADPYYGQDWFEIHNTSNSPVAIGGLYLSDVPTSPTKTQIPALSFIAAKGYQRFNANGLSGANNAAFSLKATGDTLQIVASNASTLIDRITFGSQLKDVPEGRLPDGVGGIVQMPESGSPQNPNWKPSAVVINEVLTNPVAPMSDFVELHNPTASAIDISGWWLSDDLVARQKYVFPAGSVIAAGGYLVVTEAQMLAAPVPFSLQGRGDEVILTVVVAGSPNGFGALVRFGGADANISFGRMAATGLGYSSGGAEFWRQSAATPGLENSGPRIGPVIISEIMYHPQDINNGGVLVEAVNREFIELFNITNTPVNVGGWRMKGDSEFVLPAGAIIPSRGRVLLVGFDPVANAAAKAEFDAQYPAAASATLYGPFSEKLANTTMSVEFAQPIVVDGISLFANVDKVEFRDQLPWPLEADLSVPSSPASLQRTNAFIFGNTAANWRGLAPTPAAANAGTSSSLAITSADTLPGGVNAFAYSFAFAAKDGFEPFSWDISAGSLPGGLSLGSAGDITGTPAATGLFNFTVRVTDALGNQSTKAASMTVVDTPLGITTTTLTSSYVGAPYSSSLAAIGGVQLYSWSLASGSLPAGLSLTAAGTITGIPTAHGTASFTARVTDGTGVTDDQALQLTIDPSSIEITTAAALPAAVRNVAFSQALQATGGVQPYSWTLLSGSLPAGLSLSASGQITGIPTAAGSFSFSARLTDGASIVVAKAFTLLVNASFVPPVLNPVVLPATTVGAAYTASVSAVNYPKTYSVVGLPAGITFNATTGAISGRSSVTGVFVVLVSASNTAGASATVSVPLAVRALAGATIGSFTGVIGRDPAANQGLGARLDLTVTALGTYTLSVKKGAVLTSVKGFINPTAPHISTTVTGVALTLNLASGLNALSGTHGAAVINGWRGTWNATVNPAVSRVGYYSFGLDLANPADQGQLAKPQGSGYASFSVALAGTLSVAGKTADGQAFTSAGFMGPNGEIALHGPLYLNLGSINGTVTLAEDPAGAYAENTLSGSVTWTKPANTARTYGPGFNALALTASGKYLSSVAGKGVVLGMPAAGPASLTFTDGGLSTASLDPDLSFTQTALNAVVLPLVNPTKVTLVINKSTGLVTGTFTLVDGTAVRKVSYAGMIVRPSSGSILAKGHFLLLQLPSTGQTVLTSPILSGGIQISQ
jgi:hypothetical protein